MESNKYGTLLYKPLSGRGDRTDISQSTSFDAIERVEILRDGASAQYEI
jgi:outer membrane receptor protein involved in Fe transport